MSIYQFEYIFKLKTSVLENIWTSAESCQIIKISAIISAPVKPDQSLIFFFHKYLINKRLKLKLDMGFLK